MKGKLLPIGTVVKISGGNKSAMITGYYSKGEDDSKIYTYNGCIFPEGFMQNVFLLFDQSDIEDVIYMGLENEDFVKYRDKIADMVGSTFSVNNAMEEKKENNVGGHRRTPKAPTNPMSKSEMHAKFTAKKTSGGGASDIRIVRRED